jgi:hypothetical protein
VRRLDAWAVAFLVALAALRLGTAGAVPLDAEEAAHAWRALRLAAAGDASVDGLTSPFTAAAQAVVFSLLGAGDARARGPAAACGLALVLAPLLCWSALGRARALALCLLAALVPAIGEAASALGAALVAACLLGWTAAARRRAEDARAWAYASAAAAGFLLTTGPAAWALLPPLAALAWWVRPWQAAPVRPGPLVAAALATGLLVASAGLLAIPWASAVSASLTAARPSLGPATAAALGALALAAALRHRPLAHAAAIGWGALAGPDGPALALACAACAADGLGALLEPRAPSRRALAGLAVVALLLLALRPRPSGTLSEDRVLRTLAADAAAIAVERGHAWGEMPLVIVGEPVDPAIAWSLRDLRAVEWAAVAPAGRPAAPLLVARASATGTPDGYARRTYGAGPEAVVLWVPRAP